MLERQTQSHLYWAETFKVNETDIEHLYNVLLEREEPLSADQMALVLVRWRVQEESRQIEEQLTDAALYKPDVAYQVGQEIIFPIFHFAAGKVVGVRPGTNPEYGTFEVIEVEFDAGEPTREFASQLEGDHVLVKSSSEDDDTELLSAEELFIEYGDEVVAEIESYLENHDDIVRIAGLWFPSSLLGSVNEGHLNLAEAVLDMTAGGPLATPTILEQIELAGGTQKLQEFSLNFALQEDDRFDEVGPAGQILWYLRRLEPPEVLSVPLHLQYNPVAYNPDALTPELVSVERELQDEHTPLETTRTEAQSITITLTYPHRRTGSLPLAARLKPFFPTAYRAPIIRFILVDEHSGEEMPGWVVREEGYVYGLEEWYNRNEVPVGGYLKISRTDDPGRVQIGYARRRPRSEWIRVASVADKHVVFDMKQHSIGSDFDDLMVVGIEDPDTLEALWQASDAARNNDTLIMHIFRELARLSTQNAVHARTLYSAVNVVRRMPPGPIFERLLTMDEFEYVGGAYWRFAAEEEQQD